MRKETSMREPPNPKHFCRNNTDFHRISHPSWSARDWWEIGKRYGNEMRTEWQIHGLWALKGQCDSGLAEGRWCGAGGDGEGFGGLSQVDLKKFNLQTFLSAQQGADALVTSRFSEIHKVTRRKHR